jgi:hypothetical protein
MLGLAYLSWFISLSWHIAPLTAGLFHSDINSTQRGLFTGAPATSYYTTYAGASCDYSQGGGSKTTCISYTKIDTVTQATDSVTYFSIDSQSGPSYSKNTFYFTTFVPETEAQQLVVSFSLAEINNGDSLSVWAISKSFFENNLQGDASWCGYVQPYNNDIISLAKPFNSNMFSGSCKRCSYRLDGSSCTPSNCATQGMVYLDNTINVFAPPAVNYGNGKVLYDASESGILEIYAPYNYRVIICLNSGPLTAPSSTIKFSGYRVSATTLSCNSGFYCPDGEYFERACSPGYYSSTNIAASCTECPAGMYSEFKRPLVSLALWGIFVHLLHPMRKVVHFNSAAQTQLLSQSVGFKLLVHLFFRT